MNKHDDGYFDERIASTYDDDTEMFSPAVVSPVVDFLADLAGHGEALELGIGTGRIALPLARRGVPVQGIDLSKPMLARLGAKPGGSNIGVTVGDFATTFVGHSFSVVYLLFNTIMNLTTQAAQVACFRNAAAHLKPGGCFVIEVMIPELQQLPFGETIRAFDMSKNHIGVELLELCAAKCAIIPNMSTHYTIGQFSEIVGVTVKTRKLWDREGRLKALRTHTNRRYYLDSHLSHVLGEKKRSLPRKIVVYCRVSSRQQATHLKNQREAMEHFCLSKGKG